MTRITKMRALKLSFIAIVSVILVETTGAYLTGSLALASDAAHATFDAISTLILLITTRLSLKPADKDHTYGHGKIETLGALVGGFTLLILAGVILILALSRFSDGHNVEANLFGFGAASYTLGIDVVRVIILMAALKTGSLAVKADLYHAAADFFSTGLVLVALGSTTLGYPVGDTLVSLVLAGLLGYLSIRLMHASSMDLSDAVSENLVQSIRDEIKATKEVLKVKSLRARRVGQITYVDAVVAVSSDVHVVEADTIASRIEANLSKLLGESSVMIHIEPLDWEIPLESQIRDATRKVNGARGIHNVSVAEIDGKRYVTLHAQVDPKLALDHAHEIAGSIEKGIEDSIPNVSRVTVHLEPSIPESTSGKRINDRAISDAVRSVVEQYSDDIVTDSIMIYSTQEGLHIDVRCRFGAEESITKVHELMSKIEDGIREMCGKAIITIRPEPGRRS